MDGSRIFIDENVARNVWNVVKSLRWCRWGQQYQGNASGNLNMVLHPSWKVGLHAFELNLATNLVKASANFHPFHIHDWISRGISSRIFFPSQVRFEGRVNEKCLLELSRDCRQRERTGRTTRFIRKTVFHSGWDFWKISFRSFG